MNSSLTVIVTCFREGALLRRAIRSLERQSDPDFETLIVNDCSPDAETNAICRELEQKGQRVIWRRENGGLSAARNTGAAAATGEIIAFLDADDELPAGAVAAIKHIFSQFPEADFVFGDYILYEIERGTSRTVHCATLCDQEQWLDPIRLAQNWILMGQSPIRRRALEQVGGYALAFSNTAQDVDFWMRALTRGLRGRYVGETIYTWYRSDSGMNNSEANKQSVADVYYNNLPFIDRFSSSVSTREYLLGEYLKRGQFDRAHLLARQLVISYNLRKRPYLLLSLMPPWLTSRSYRWYRQLRRMSLLPSLRS